VPLLAGSSLLLDTSARLLTDTEVAESVELTEKETRVLEVLVQAAGVPVPKDHLLAEVWAYQPEINTRTLETHLSRLRTKLQQFPSSVALVLEEGGYKLTRL
jgi:DNA-binding response OmpR family regulator